MKHGRLVEALTLLTEVPRYTPSQWQRLFWDAGLKRATVHLFLRDTHPNSPWTMVVDSQRGVVDLDAFEVSLPNAILDQSHTEPGSEEWARSARAHAARIELHASEGRCPQTLAHHLVARVAAGILRTTYGVGWLHHPSGILLPAQRVVQSVRTLSGDEVPVELFATIRDTRRGPTVVVDTMGLPGLDLPDLEIEVDAGDVAEAREFVATVASQMVSRQLTLEDETTIAGPLGLRWRSRLAKASHPPLRGVRRFGLAG